MTAPAWCAVAAALALSALPSPTAVRADDLATRGRLAVRRRPARLAARPISWPPVAAGAAALVVGLIAARAGPVLAATAGAVLAVAGFFGRDLVRRRRAARRHRDLLTALQVLVGELEAGAQFAGALAAASGVGGSSAAVLGRAAELVGRGDDPSEVLAAGGDELRAVAAAWRVSDASGAAPAAVLDRVARDVAAADDRRRAVTVALAGPRSSALVLSGLPLVGIALGVGMGADPIAFLIGEPAGRLLCGAGVLLDLAGLVWMRALVRRAER